MGFDLYLDTIYFLGPGIDAADRARWQRITSSIYTPATGAGQFECLASAEPVKFRLGSASQPPKAVANKIAEIY